MKQYLKGALHVHTNLSDGVLSPQEVVAKYKSKGYDFIVFTDHKYNFNIEDHVKDNMGLVLIGGVELDPGVRSDDDYKNMTRDELISLFATRPNITNEFCDNIPGSPCHVNALGVHNTRMGFEIDYNSVPKTCENMIDVILANGGIPMINHPNWESTISLREVMNVNRDFLMEIGGAYDCVYGGNHNLESVESMWDVLLTQGKKVFGTFTDDSHSYKEITDECLDPGYDEGYVCVWAERDEKSILDALREGEFYCSNGIYLDEYEVTDKKIRVKIKPNTYMPANILNKGEFHYAIMFKGEMGYPLKVVYGTEAEYEFKGNLRESYVRVKVVSNKKRKSLWQVENNKYYEALFTQPVFKNNG